MFKSIFVLLSILVLAACSSMLEETPPVVPGGSNPVPPAVTVDPEVERWFRETAPAGGMRLMAGDRVRIDVQGKPDLSVVRDVPPNGKIPVIRANKSVVPVDALGKTAQDLELEIAKMHQEDFEHPYVTVTVESEAPRSIYVYGAVKTPNQYPMSGNERLTVLQAFVMAAGTTPQADLRSVTIQRIFTRPGHRLSGQMVVSPPLDLTLAIDQGNQRDNLNVEPGDTIVVPDLQQSSVQVLGNVEKPGSVAWSKGMTLARAITEAGGFKRFAKKAAIKIVRHGRDSFTVNFDEIVDGAVPDPELEPRDVIYVPERWM